MAEVHYGVIANEDGTYSITASTSDALAVTAITSVIEMVHGVATILQVGLPDLNIPGLTEAGMESKSPDAVGNKAAGTDISPKL